MPGKTDYGIHLVVCAYCGEIFRVEEMNKWAYKRGNKKGKMYYFCSYGCARKIDGGYPIGRWKMPINEEA